MRKQEGGERWKVEGEERGQKGISTMNDGRWVDV